MKQLLMAFAFAALAISLAPIARASGSIDTFAGACPSSYPNLGYADVEWSVTSDEPDNVAVWVSAINYYSSGTIPANLQAMAREGENYCPWIEYQYDYSWDLWAGADGSGHNGTWLDTGYFFCG
jgi:hypothetical protein